MIQEKRVAKLDVRPGNVVEILVTVSKNSVSYKNAATRLNEETATPQQKVYTAKNYVCSILGDNIITQYEKAVVP